jgi:hypothetical protein
VGNINVIAALEAPQRFQDLYPATMQCKSRMMLGAMVSAMDEAVGNITDALKRTQLWENSLLVWVADNGGPTGVGAVSPASAASCAANNFPLRGGKGSAFQGGVRTAAFMAGGVLPPAVRGTKYTGYIHIADWFATFANIAGIPGAASADDGTAPRPSDSIDAWPGLTKQPGATVRTEMALSIQMYGGPRTRPHPGWRIEDGALIVGRLKLIIGKYLGMGVHFYPTYPNSTERPNASDPGCPNQGPHGPGPTGCLYDIIADPEVRCSTSGSTAPDEIA